MLLVLPGIREFVRGEEKTEEGKGSVQRLRVLLDEIEMKNE